ncbi:23S rRNA (uracil(1939)-C(5))-methyltransferase RlmD [Peptoclostridium acidaminophilum]|nr:23S rRNA (uracil(1939)-C(5))-methyltransferase RlmD [Peptoclostridium acidaminophilum]
MLRESGIYEVEIIDLTEKGEGIGKIEGLTVFVDGTLVGDKAKVKLTKLKKNYATGELIELISPSEGRVESLCPYDECGGCQVMNLSYKKQLELKKNSVTQTLRRIGSLDESVSVHDVLGMEYPYEYRNKAQFPVGKKDGEIVVGFYKKGTHDIVDAKSCCIHRKVNEQIIELVKYYMKENNISAYDETIHKGTIRHIVTKIGFTTGEIMVVIVTNSKKLKNANLLAHALKSNIPGFKTLVQNVNMDKTNVILGKHNNIVYGEGKITDFIGSLSFEISPLSFFQVNPLQTRVLYEKALEYAALTGDETVFDIYCGTGTISLFLAQKARKVYGIEVIQEAIDAARENAVRNGIQNTEFFTGKAEDVVPRLYEQGYTADVVVVDPPRKGCDEKVLGTIVEMHPKRVVYVSCNPSTLARDIKYLCEKGFKVKEVQPVDMFPHTMHVETVCLMSKVNK